MNDERDDRERRETEPRRRPRSGLPGIVIFLGALFGLVLLLESFSKGFVGRETLELDQFLEKLYTGAIDQVCRHGDTHITGKYFDAHDGLHQGSLKDFTCELPLGEFEALSADMREFVR